MASKTVCIVLLCQIAPGCAGGSGDGNPSGPTPVVAAIRLGLSSATIANGQSLVIEATPADASGASITGKNVTCGSDNSGVSVDGAGKLTGASAGTSIVTAILKLNHHSSLDSGPETDPLPMAASA